MQASAAAISSARTARLAEIEAQDAATQAREDAERERTAKSLRGFGQGPVGAAFLRKEAKRQVDMGLGDRLRAAQGVVKDDD